MQIFIIATLVSFVLKFVSLIVISFYKDAEKSDEELSDSFIFNLAVLIYVINTGLILINGSILLALIIKTYLI